MIDELNHAILHCGGDREEVKDREVLNILAEADSSGVRADRFVKLCGQQKNGKVFVDAGDTAAIKLDDVDGVGLEELLEHDAVMAVLASGYADLGDFVAYAGVAEN